uniref:Kelch-like protein 10 n=1 Tax=Mastacembelus armatus TaxID=205130 RepID=A0A3Q3MFM1_9TELE
NITDLPFVFTSFHFKNPQNMSETSSVYNELRQEKQLCDALIRVDNVEFHVHKLIMCNCSPYFRALFTHWATPDSGVFDIPDVSADMMKIIIEYAYTGIVSVRQEIIQELFIVADRFNVTGINKVCSDLLEEQMTPQNCIGIWRFMNVYYYPELKHKAFLFTLNHFETVAATSQEFLLLSAQELAQIIESNQLNVKKEERVFEAIMRWINYTPEERRGCLSLLLSKVRLAVMCPEYLMDIVNGNGVVKENEDCHTILLKALDIMLEARTKSFSNNFLWCPLACPRLPSAILLAIGGWSGGSPTNAIEAYDVRAGCWVSVPNDDAVPRAYHGTAFFNGSVYSIGGFDSGQQFSAVHRFDLATQTWHEVAPMHSKRCYVSVTVMDGYIYALGGYDGHDRLDTAERYRPSTNQWTLIASMHQQRSDASCATLRGKVYICGGFNGFECLSTVECYNPETDQWTMITSMSTRRSGIGVIAYAGHIFAVGGFNGTTRLHTAEAYNADTNSWYDVPSMLRPRSNFGIEVIDDHIFVVGGFNGFTTTLDAECFSIEAGEWSDVCDMVVSRSALSCCVIYGIDDMAEFSAPRCSLQFSNRWYTLLSLPVSSVLHDI